MRARGSSTHGAGRFRRSVGWAGALPGETARRFRRASHSKGAGESGLGKLIELHALNNAGDALVTIALATSVFFSVPTGEARDRVALYLLVTMAPFALMAPIIGPLLDRLRRGRRVAIAVTMLGRAVLAYMMASSIEDASLELYPEAFGVLMISKAYGVSRSAVVPRLQPRSMSLVKVNSRITLFGLIGTMLAAPVAGALKFGHGTSWIMYAAAVVFVVGAVLTFTLPSKVDSAKGEDRASFTHEAPGVEHEPHFPGHRPRKGARRLRSVGPSVVLALWANASLRGFSGFLIMFLGFLLREQPVGGLGTKQALGAVVIAAAVGNAVGTALGAWFKSKAPEAIIFGVVAVSAGSAVAAALFYGLPTVLAVAAVAGLAQALGKLSLDAMIQRDIPEEVRTSAFARSETALQLAWVVGGAIGIALPLNGTLGMGVAAAVLLLTLFTAARRLTTRRTRPARSPGFRLRGAR
ncbi:MFS transporter [Yinghuangia seranimata]|uniref:MFS transporter n=1 Tax=Yinghuangia seranimata TaxID=408067 RepID=UPI00248C1E9F|nr:MFS transporter [Yinghuangia seranimata]MDI2131239.1 MFS transporter [Yinghuangia seranimata]